MSPLSLRSAVALLFTTTVVQLVAPNPLEICNADITKYMYCVQSEYNKELDRITAYNEPAVQRRLSECFAQNKCIPPPEYAEDEADGKAQPIADESTADESDEAEPFETKMVLNEQAFPGSKGQEYNKTMSRCLLKAEDEQKKSLLTCMQSSLVGFTYPKDVGVPRIQDFVDSAIRGLTSKRNAFDVEASAVYYHLADIRSTCKSWRNVHTCLMKYFKEFEDSSYDMISKSEGMRDMWCKIHGGCLKSLNVKCYKVIDSLKQIECDCLRKNQENMVKTISSNYERCLGYKVKSSLIVAKVNDTMEAVCGADSAPPECSKI